MCFDAAWPELQAHITAWVSPEDDIEFRQVELRNSSQQVIEIELISAFDVTLAEAAADEAHPAFGGLFVTAQWQPAQHALVFERRPRLAIEAGLHMAHFLALGETFEAAASNDALTLRALVDKYRQASSPSSNVQRASLMSAALAGIRLRGLRISADNFAAVQTLTTALVQGLHRAPPAALPLAPGTAQAADAAGSDALQPAVPCDRRLLWRQGISGERPLLLVSASALQGMGLLRSLAQALRLWAWGGISADLVVVNAEPASYVMALPREIGALRDRHLADTGTAAIGFHLLHHVNE